MVGAREIQHLANRLLRLVGIGRLRLLDDTGLQQLAQVSIAAGGPAEMAEVIEKTPRLGEYGLASCPPDGAEAIVLFLGGRRSNGVIVATGHRPTRPTGLQAGEAMLYNGVTGKWLKMAADGKARSNAEHRVDALISATELRADNGASGTFTSADGKTITVSHGIITSIV